MKSKNIIKKLEKEGYEIAFKKWGYWNNIPHVKLNRFCFAIAEYTYQNNWLGVNLNFIYNHVLEALELAKMNNPILLKKIEAGWDYGQYLIISMEDYYKYKKKKYPFNEYDKILEKLKRN